MRPTFGREHIETEFKQISDQLENPVTVYLIGGGVLSVRDLKTATKDIEERVAYLEEFGRVRRTGDEITSTVE